MTHVSPYANERKENLNEFKNISTGICFITNDEGFAATEHELQTV